MSYIFPVFTTIQDALGEPGSCREVMVDLGVEVVRAPLDPTQGQTGVSRELLSGVAFSLADSAPVCRPFHLAPYVDHTADSRMADLLTYGDFTMQPRLTGAILCGLPVSGGFRLICPYAGITEQSLAAEAWVNADLKRRDRYVWELNKLRVEGATATFNWVQSLLLLGVRDCITGEYWSEDSFIFSRLPYHAPVPATFTLENLIPVEDFPKDAHWYTLNFPHTDHRVTICTNGKEYFKL